MSTTSHPTEHTSDEAHERPAISDGAQVMPGPVDHTGGHSDAFYVKIAIILAVLTGLEVSLTYLDIGPLFLPLLLTLMVIKFFMVVLFFMHLKFDSPWFSFFFYAGLFLAVSCYVGALATFEFFLQK